MAQELDSLEVKIDATATPAIKSVESLIKCLGRLSDSLMNINSSSLTGLSNGINQLNSAMQNMNAKTTDFTRLAKNITKIGSVDSVALNNTAVSLQAVNKAIGSISAIPNNAAQVTEFAKSLGKLGSKSIENATVNIPKLGNALNGLMTTLSRAPSVSSNVIQMTNALANLASQGSKVGSSSTSLQKSLYGVSNSARSTSNSSWSLARSFGKLYANYFLVIRGAKQLWKSIESSMDYVETLNYFNAAFGQVAESAVKNWKESGYDSAEAYYNSFSKRAEELTSKMSGYTVSDSGMLVSTSQKSLGIDPEQLMNYQSVFGQMSSSMGTTSENALILSNVLSEIGADLASVKNMDFSKVWNDMSSGLAGMSRTLDKYGVNIRNVNLQQELTNLGITANITNLNQNEKALLRTIILLNSTKYAWGDLSRTLDQPANQLRLLQANFSNLGRTIGNIFLPMVAKVLPYINALTIVAQRAAQAIVSFLGFSDFDWGGLGGMSSNDALSDIYDEVGDVSDGLSDATGNAKELKNTLMGFDEINKLSDTTDSSGSSTSGSGLSAADTAKLDEAFKKMASEYQAAWDKAFEGVSNRAQELADEIEKKIKSGDWYGIGELAGKQINKGINAFPWKKTGQTITKAICKALEFADGFVSSVDWEKLGKDIVKFIEGINLGEIAVNVSDLTIDLVLAAIKLLWGAYQEVYDKWGIAGILAALVVPGGVVTLKFITEFSSSIEDSKYVKKAKEGIENIKIAIQEKWGEITDWWNNTAVVNWWNDDVMPWFKKETWLEAVDGMKIGIQEKWQELSNWWGDTAIVSWWDDSVKPYFTKEKWSDLAKGIKTGIQEKWGEVVEWWNSKPALEWISVKVEDFKTKVQNAWNSFKDWWDGLGLSFPHIDLPHFKINGEFSLMPPKVPKIDVDWYANGGFPNKGQLFVANEVEPEMVGTMDGRTAVANQKEITTGITNAVYPAVYNAMVAALGNMQNNQQGDIVVQIDGKEVFRATQREANNYTNMTGQPAFLL